MSENTLHLFEWFKLKEKTPPYFWSEIKMPLVAQSSLKMTKIESHFVNILESDYEKKDLNSRIYKTFIF